MALGALPFQSYELSGFMEDMAKEAERRLKAQGEGRYMPRGNIRVIQKARNRELILCGPAGTGKSRGWLEKIHRILSKHPNVRVLMVRKTRRSLSESTLQTYEDHVLGVDNPIRNGPQRMHREKYVYPLGGELVVGGMDPDQKTRVMSTEYDIIYVPEATELAEDDWEALSMRLRNNRLPFQQIGGDCNPGPPSHWIKRRADEKRLVMLNTTHRDNPVLWDELRMDWTEFGKEYVTKTLAGLSGVRRKRFFLGLWAAAEGQVYEEWDPNDFHLIDKFIIPETWPRIISVDFGYKNPFVAQFWALDHDRRMYLYRELYGTERLTEDWGKELYTLAQGERIEAVICDHDAQERATLEKYLRRKTLPAKKSIKDGIQAVQDRLRPQADGYARLYILRDCLVRADQALIAEKKPWKTEQEFDSYIWAPGTDGKPKKEEPVDLDNHGMDALRYAVAYLDLRAKGGRKHSGRSRSMQSIA